MDAVSASSSRPTSTDCFSPLLALLAAFWILPVAAGQLLAQFVVTGMFTLLPNWVSGVFPLAQALLLALPLTPLAIFWKAAPYRAVFRTWLFLSLLGLPMALAHLLRADAAQLQALYHLLVGLAYSGLILGVAWLRQKRQGGGEWPRLRMGATPGRLARALLLTTPLAYPWLAWGALGSLLDTLLALLEGLAFGLAAATTFEFVLFPPLRGEADKRGRNLVLSSYAAGLGLIILSGGMGFPYGAMQMMLGLSLSALGWFVGREVLFWKETSGGGSSSLLPLALGLGWAMAAPLALVDADELLLVVSLSEGEILQWAFFAALASLGIGLAMGLVGIVTAARRPAEGRRFAGLQTLAVAGALLLAWGAGAGIYVSFGQPGFHGEGLFVILEDQADLSRAARIADDLERRTYVYETLVAHAERTQADLRRTFERLGLAYTPYYLVNAIQVDGGPLLRLYLLTRPEVDRVLPNPWLRPLPAPLPETTGHPVSELTIPWNISLIGADRVWEEFGVTGEGIVVGQSDSGVQGNHPEVADSYRGQGGLHDYNWFDPWNHTSEPTDRGGHGTHTLGTILGNTVGVAPGATWYACVNLGRNLGNPARYLDCMQFMLAPFPRQGDPFRDGIPGLGANVINNSWGCPEIEGCDALSLLDAVRNLRYAGVFVVVSAGNDGPRCNTLNTPPALYDEAFSIGAINQEGEVSFFSSIGPVTADGSGRVKPDLLAPGEGILSSMPGSTYQSNSGTSMAGPHVVGVVALMWSANPGLIGEIERTEQILIETATPYGGPLRNCPGAGDYPSTVAGYGVVNAYEAVKAALNLR